MQQKTLGMSLAGLDGLPEKGKKKKTCCLFMVITAQLTLYTKKWRLHMFP